MSVSVQADDFDIAAEIAAMTRGNHDIGAVVSFIGLVREMTPDGAIEGLELEHYPGMTERALAGIVDQARQRWQLQGVRVIHRFGPLVPGDRIVLVLAASSHRQAAFEAASFLMDYLKTQAPFWKKETRSEGKTRWVAARDSDDAAAERWKN